VANIQARSGVVIFMTTTTSKAAIPTTTDRARLKDGVHIELSPRRVRTYFGGKLIADSERVLLVYESKRPPAYWFPISDVRMEHLEEKPDAEAGTTRWRIRAGEKVAENGARAFADPSGELAPLEGHLTFYWKEMDSWFEEDQEVFVHPRDPYTRVDTVNSSKHVKIEVDGVTIAETRRPVLLYETGLPTRYYIPKQDVRMDLLEPTDTHTRCPYKGVASYWSLRLGDKTVKDIVWSYPAPIQESARIENLLSFYPDKVEIYVDGVRTA